MRLGVLDRYWNLWHILKSLNPYRNYRFLILFFRCGNRLLFRICRISVDKSSFYPLSYCLFTSFFSIFFRNFLIKDIVQVLFGLIIISINRCASSTVRVSNSKCHALWKLWGKTTILSISLPPRDWGLMWCFDCVTFHFNLITLLSKSHKYSSVRN